MAQSSREAKQRLWEKADSPVWKEHSYTHFPLLWLHAEILWACWVQKRALLWEGVDEGVEASERVKKERRV